MKEQIEIAVIDSGVNNQDSSLQGFSIEDYYYDNQEIKSNFNGSINMHGTEVIKIILKEAPKVKIVSIKILNENNKCMLSDVIRAMRFAIDRKVNVINLSLGSCISRSKSALELEKLCNEAANKGIAIFAAENNPIGEHSFPASFDCVIGVTSTTPDDPYCKVEYQKKMISFSESLVYVPDKTRTIVRNGNSFLCPLLVGIFCRFANGKQINQKLIMEYILFLEDVSKQGNIKKIFFNRYSEDKYLLVGKKVLFFADDSDMNNIRLYDMYKEVCNISLCFDEIMDLELEQIRDYVNKVDIFYIGSLSPEFIYSQSKFLYDLIKTVAESRIQIITVFPIINTYKRILLTADNKCEIKSIYK